MKKFIPGQASVCRPDFLALLDHQLQLSYLVISLIQINTYENIWTKKHISDSFLISLVWIYLLALNI